LVDHFREVELTFETPPRLPTAAPKTRLQMRMPAAVVRFIESRFDPEKTSQQIRSVLGEARDWTDSPGQKFSGKSRLISSTPVSG
jgi:hypothetical protein